MKKWQIHMIKAVVAFMIGIFLGLFCADGLTEAFLIGASMFLVGPVFTFFISGSNKAYIEGGLKKGDWIP